MTIVADDASVVCGTQNTPSQHKKYLNKWQKQLYITLQ
jgi:hypothetical protein